MIQDHHRNPEQERELVACQQALDELAATLRKLRGRLRSARNHIANIDGFLDRRTVDMQREWAAEWSYAITLTEARVAEARAKRDAAKARLDWVVARDRFRRDGINIDHVYDRIREAEQG